MCPSFKTTNKASQQNKNKDMQIYLKSKNKALKAFPLRLETQQRYCKFIIFKPLMKALDNTSRQLQRVWLYIGNPGNQLKVVSNFKESQCP